MARVRVKARTLDMLGRQQMASIPNALHELFKNAYDAYADNVTARYYRQDALLVLHDDGVGMTERDFEERWLTLGTESKITEAERFGTDRENEEFLLSRPYADPNKPVRPSLGEKGIGRLAIATVGPQVFVFSRAERKDGLQELVAAFINWTMFEAPGIELDKIDIAVAAFPTDSLPDEDALRILLEDARRNYLSLRPRIVPEIRKRIEAQLASCENALPRIADLVTDLPLLSARGTAFIVCDTDPVLERDIDDRMDDFPPALLRFLRGFSNTMMPDKGAAPIRAAFFDHRRDGTVEDVLGDTEFFTPEEFRMADQHIEGTFDEYGQFSGTVQIYRDAPQPYTVAWDGAHHQPTKCGPFRIKFACLQGNPKESLLPPDRYKPLVEKLNNFGGLYVYREGIRVLPYGNSDQDYLFIETRRSKAAKDWYFSYRRIFGAVELTFEDNSELKEKAGREGFRENMAYRQFRNMLINLFRQLATDWFREKSSVYGTFWEQKNELQRQAELLEKREKSVIEKRKKLAREIDAFFGRIEAHEPEKAVERLRSRMNDVLMRVAEESPEEAARILLQIEAEMNDALAGLRETCRLVRPRSVGLTKKMQAELERANAITLRLESDLFTPFEKEVDERITRAIGAARALVSRRRRLQQALEQREKRENTRARAIVKHAREDADQLGKEVLARTREGLATLDATFKQAFADLERESLADMDDTAATEFQDRIERNLASAVKGEVETLERLRDSLQAVLESLRENTLLNETTAALEDRGQVLQEELDRSTELAHLGTAIGIIQHEFNSSVVAIRNGLNRLKGAVSDDPGAQDSYSLVRASFEHLDTYLSMFAPLNRRLYRKPIELAGANIRKYLLQIFAERFKRHNVRWESTQAFERHAVTAFPATFLPPFINVVDNALFWLSRTSDGNLKDDDGSRTIFFDADATGYLVSNNGPGVAERDAEQIFELSYTRKLRGRGMGLAIARKALREAGCEITLEACGKDAFPVFKIWTSAPTPKQQEERHA